MNEPMSLTSRRPELRREQLIAGLVPPPHFAAVTFDTYRPDSSQPSQAAALADLRRFAEEIVAGATKRKRRFGRTGSGPGDGRYLDGGFGVGKTHLLAALWHASAPAGPRAYATFVELTNLVGALGFEATVDALSEMRLLCIDEFELDDPGDTVMMSTLAARLSDNGVRLAATSNTLPDRLGEDRFAADDFLREIQGLAARFTVVRIDGDDYRHRGLPSAPQPASDAEVIAAANGYPNTSLDNFNDLVAHLAEVHPSRYGAMLAGVKTVCWLEVRQLTDQSHALRLVAFVDRMYDHEVSLVASGCPVDQVFSPEMLAGGYRKKYRRAISRLAALARS